MTVVVALMSSTVVAAVPRAYPLSAVRRTSRTVLGVNVSQGGVSGLLAAFPAPPTDAFHVGPLRVGFYGLMIAVGAFLAVQLFGARLERLGVGTRDDASRIATFALPAGVLGSRLYHVVTAWELYRDRPLAALRFWEGGLGIWGGVAAGVVVGVLVARRRGLPGGAVVTAVTPALPLAQAFGRWGNWFNQELFGRPTGLPWGLEVTGRAFPPGFAPGTLFHPTFLYESLGCLLLVAVLLVVERSGGLRPGRLFLVYVAGYSLLRFPIESLRIDPAPVLAGLRLNQWVAVVLVTCSSGVLLGDLAVRRSDR